MSEAAFDYSRAARDAGWRLVGDIWLRTERRDGTPGPVGAGYKGTVRELCFLIGIGPEFEAWKHKPYVKPSS